MARRTRAVGSGTDSEIGDPVTVPSDAAGAVPVADAASKPLIVQRRIDRMAADGVEDEASRLVDFVDRFRGSDPDGSLRVERIGPHQLPRDEIGHLELVPVRDWRGDPADEIQRRWGGGEYRIAAILPDGLAVPGASFTVRIAGLMRPKSPEGRRWLRENYPDEFGPAQQRTNGPDVTEIARTVFDLVERVGRRDDGSSAIVRRVLDELGQQRQREDAAATAAQQRQLEELRASITRSQNETAAQLERMKLEQQERLEKLRLEAESREKEAERRHELELERLRADARSHAKQMEMMGSGGMGAGMFRRMGMELLQSYQDVGRAMLERNLGLDQQDEDWGSIFKGVVREAGPEAVRAIGNAVAGAGKGREQTSAPAHALPTLPGMPGMPTPPAPPALPPSAGQQQADQAAHAEMARRVRVFVDAVARELRVRGDAAHAWSNGDPDLETLFAQLPESLRVQLVQGGWPAFLQVLNAAQPVVQYLTTSLSDPSAGAWLQALLDAGPWHDAGDDESEADGGA